MAGNDVYKLNTSTLSFVYMAKLYWRIKRNGKWTWSAATTLTLMGRITVVPYSPEEEEE